MAYNGKGYFVVWRDTRQGIGSYDIYGTRIDLSGKVLDPDGIAISTVEGIKGNPAIAFGHSNALVVWRD